MRKIAGVEESRSEPKGLPDAPWRGKVFFWPGRMLYLGFGSSTTFHVHHAIQISLALEGTFELRTRSGPLSSHYQAALVAPDHPHELRAEGVPVALLYVEADSLEGRKLRTLWPRGIAELPELDPQISRFRRAASESSWSEAQAAELCDEVIRVLVGTSSGLAPIHPSVPRAISFLRSSLERRIRLEELADIAGLSAGRFVHVFTAHVGIPVRRYVLWLRLQRAGEELMRGGTITEAAHAAGFFDGAHLSRTFRRMFGTSPSSVVRGSQFVQARGPRRP